MKIIFNSKIGEMFDLFRLLCIINSYDDYVNSLQEHEIEYVENHEKFLLEFREDKSIDTEKMKFYFNDNFIISDIFITYNELWNYSNLGDYFDFISNLNATDIKFRLIKKLLKDISNGNSDDEIEVKSKEISQNYEKNLKFIKNLNIDSSVKWDLFCLIQEPEKYRDEYVEYMRNLSSKFYKVYDTKRKTISEFNNYIEDNLNKEGFKFLNNIANNVFKYDSFDKVHISTTYTNYYSLTYEVIENVAYICLGLGFEEVFAKLAGKEEDKLQRNLNIYKNFSDKTRFKILKLLIEKEDYYSKDIAQKLGITGATVSYHMDYLFSSNIIQIDRKNRKNICTINKDVIRESIDYLIEEFKLRE